jgi:translation initiation factor 2B subunit (eIF-2B alpha/beta/delta family)
VASLPVELARRISLLASDRESGASDILDETLKILGDARAAGVPMKAVARAVCRAQPSMASVWNAALEALAGEQVPDRFDRFTQRVARAADALSRFAADAFADAEGAGPLRLVTISLSRSVAVVFDAVRRERPIRVCCSESRPALEGRRFASRLADAGVPVTCFSDAAIAHALAAADAVVVGADAIGPEWFLNKSGTRMLAAAAAQQGVPVYVAATRDKFVGHAVGARLVIREGAPGEIWDTPPPGVEVRNPYFESTPLDVVTTVISDAGVLGIGMIPDVCDAAHDPLLLKALDDLG